MCACPWCRSLMQQESGQVHAAKGRGKRMCKQTEGGGNSADGGRWHLRTKAGKGGPRWQAAQVATRRRGASQAEVPSSAQTALGGNAERS